MPVPMDAGHCPERGGWRFACTRSSIRRQSGDLVLRPHVARCERHEPGGLRGASPPGRRLPGALSHLALGGLGLFLVATDVAAGMHQTCRALAAGASWGHGTVDASVWWIVPAVLLLGAVGSRALLDMWPSRLSIAAAAMAAACYAVAGAGEVGWLVIEDTTAQAMLVEGAAMGGHFLLFMTVALYARHVLLDAEGLLPRRETRQAAPRRSRNKKPSTAQDDLQTSATTGQSNVAASARSESVVPPVRPPVKPIAPSSASAPAPPRVVPPAIGAAPLAAKLPAKTAAPPSSAPVSAGQESLSKADRKALKKRLLEERLKREQQGASRW